VINAAFADLATAAQRHTRSMTAWIVHARIIISPNALFSRVISAVVTGSPRAIRSEFICDCGEAHRAAASFPSLRLNINTNIRTLATSILNCRVSLRLCSVPIGAPCCGFHIVHIVAQKC
jgi:hypothetical protein